MLGLAGLAFAACSSDDEVPQMTDNTEGNVRVTLSLGRTVGTRSLGVTADGQYNLIQSLQFVFYDGSGNYVAYPLQGELNGIKYNNQTAISEALANLNKPDTHSTEVVLKDIPGSAKKLLIIANNKSTGDINTGSLTQTQASIIHLSEQNKNEFKVFSGEESTLSGLAESFSTQQVEGKVAYNASVELRPVPSRIEVGNITATSAPYNYTGADISKFKVLGYYINNFYTTGALSAQLEPSQRQKVDNGSDATKYTQEAYGKLDKIGDFTFMCDEPTEGQIEYVAGETPNIWQGTTAKNEQQANQYWGYQILKGDVPHIVIKLSVDYAEKGDIPAQENVVKFLTISGYKYGAAFREPFDADGDGEITTFQTGAPVKYMHRGHVYKVENIVFNANDLTEAPYEETKNIQAMVTVSAWKGVPVTPEFQ